MIKLATILFGEDNMKSLIVFLAAMAMAHSGFAAEPAETKKEPAKAVKAKPAATTPTATPGVIKIEKKEGAAKEEKLPKPTVKRPEELAAEKAKK
jgi:hypothetical protein